MHQKLLLAAIGFTLLLRGWTTSSDAGVAGFATQNDKETPHSRKKLLQENAKLSGMLEVYQAKTADFKQQNSALLEKLKEGAAKSVAYNVAAIQKLTEDLEDIFSRSRERQEMAVDWAKDSASLMYSCRAPTPELQKLSDGEFFEWEMPTDISFTSMESSSDKTPIREKLEESYGRLKQCEKVLKYLHYVIDYDPTKYKLYAASHVDRCTVQLMLANIELHEHMRKLTAARKPKVEAFSEPFLPSKSDDELAEGISSDAFFDAMRVDEDGRLSEEEFELIPTRSECDADETEY